MKRSLVNQSIIWAKQLLERHDIHLPRFAYWSPEEWQENADKTQDIQKLMLGWDVTDYGLECFNEIGAVLFTLRNGNAFEKGIGTPYAEKYIIIKRGQRLPMHMHKDKTEDVINRCGGTFSIKLYAAKPNWELDREGDVTYLSDGIQYTVPAGSVVDVTNGNSITLKPGLYHSFWAKDADAVIGEVSSINDDNIDNYFTEEVSRFTQIEEDEAPLYPLCNEY